MMLVFLPYKTHLEGASKFKNVKRFGRIKNSPMGIYLWHLGCSICEGMREQGILWTPT